MNDSAGGAIITWSARLSDQEKYIRHVSKVTSEGYILWQKDFKRVDQLISDGAGGTIIANSNPVSSDENDLFVIKIDSKGGFPWGEKGVSVVFVPRKGYQEYTLQLTSDGVGGHWCKLQLHTRR